MFGFFKKKDEKPTESIEPAAMRAVSEREWILWLTAPYVMTFNKMSRSDTGLLDCELLELSTTPLAEPHHDNLMYDLSGLTAEDLPVAINNRLNKCFPDSWSEILADVYIKPDDVLEENKKLHRDNGQEYKAKSIDYIQKHKKRFENTYYNGFLIITHMWRVRIAAYNNMIDHETAWRLLERLASESKNFLAGMSGWDVFIDNMINCINIESGGPSLDENAMKDAKKRLLERPDSPLRQIDFHAYIDAERVQSQPAFSNIIDEKAYNNWKRADPGYARVFELLRSDGDKQPLWDMLTEIRANTPEMYDNIFRGVSVDTVRLEDIIDLPDRYPDNGLAWLLRSEWYTEWAWEARGGGTNDTVTEDNADLFKERNLLARRDARKALELMPEDPNSLPRLIESTYHCHEPGYEDEREQATQILWQRFPHHIRSMNILHHYSVRKWGGSHEQSYDLARAVIQANDETSEAPILLFKSAVEEWFWYKSFERDTKKANAFLDNSTELRAELDHYYPQLLATINPHSRVIPAYLMLWYERQGDRQKQKEIAQKWPAIADLYPLTYLYNEYYIKSYLNWLRYL